MDGRSLGWTGYSGWGSTPTPALPGARNGPAAYKRSRSDTEDGDDAYSDQSSKDQCSSPGDPESCQLKSRKKRRGIIEKRRRDRINTSLGELRRLVPTAYEKQGSAKLEKAEILQMTVDHLKMLHTRGCNPLSYDSGKFALDYHNIGFQECVAEVNKYLMSMEGLEIHDPLRMRLISHLQNVTASREFASKQSPWYPAAAPPAPPHPSQPYQPSIGGRPPPPSLPLTPSHHTSLESSSSSHELNSSNINSSFDTSGSSGPGGCEPAAPPSTTQSSTPSTVRPLTTISSSDGYNYLHHNPHQHSMDLYHHPHLHQPNPYGQGQSDPSVKQPPYRPWGAEVAY